MAGTRQQAEPPPSLGEKRMRPYLMGEDELPELMLPPPPMGLDELPELEAPAPPPGPFPGYPPPPGLVVCCSHAASASSVETPIATKRWRSFMATPFLRCAERAIPSLRSPPYLENLRADRPTRSMQSEQRIFGLVASGRGTKSCEQYNEISTPW